MQNKTKRNGTNRNETRQTKQNKTKQQKYKQNKQKQEETNKMARSGFELAACISGALHHRRSLYEWVVKNNNNNNNNNYNNNYNNYNDNNSNNKMILLAERVCISYNKKKKSQALLNYSKSFSYSRSKG